MWVQKDRSAHSLIFPKEKRNLHKPQHIGPSRSHPGRCFSLPWHSTRLPSAPQSSGDKWPRNHRSNDPDRKPLGVDESVRTSSAFWKLDQTQAAAVRFTEKTRSGILEDTAWTSGLESEIDWSWNLSPLSMPKWKQFFDLRPLNPPPKRLQGEIHCTKSFWSMFSSHQRLTSV